MKKLVLALVVPLFGGTAFAQSADGSEDPAAPATGAADPAAPDPAAPAPGDAPASRYPSNIIDRVLTYPKGVIAVGLDVQTNTSTFFDPANLRVLGGYGITDDLEINFGAYAFPTNDAGKGSIDLNAGYKLLRGAAGGKLEMIGRVQTGYSLANEGLNPLLLGAHVQYNVTPKIAIITPGQQLSIALDGDNKAVFFALPVSVGVQIMPKLYAQLDTTLASFKIANSENAFIFGDTTPIAITGFYTPMPNLDVFAGFALNLTPPDKVDAMTMMTSSVSVSDTFGILVGARYYIGQL